MPSGFQQDSNQLTASYYRVVISCGDNSAYWYEESDGNEAGTNEGRISTLSWDNFEGDQRPNTLRKARALARGNLRFQAIVEALSGLADCQILDIEHDNGATNMQDNDVIAFTVKYDRDEGVFPAYAAIRKAEGVTDYDGTVTYDSVVYPRYWSYSGAEYSIDGPERAITDIIWKTLASSHTRSVRVFHPVEGSDPLEGEGFQEVITASKPFDNDGNALNDISVNEINGTTTTISYD